MDHSTNAVEMSRHEKQLEYHRKWYAENRERVLAQRRERYRRDPKVQEKEIIAYKKWYAENRERILAKRRERYKSDPEYHAKIDYNNKKWMRNHPDAIAASKLRQYVNALRREGYTVIPPEGVEG